MGMSAKRRERVGLEPQTLVEAQAMRLGEVEAIREALLFGSMQDDLGREWLIRQRDRDFFTGRLAMYTSGARLQEADSPWKDIYGVTHILTYADIKELCAEIEAWTEAVFWRASAHEQAILALESIEAVLAYDVRAGWPM